MGPISGNGKKKVRSLGSDKPPQSKPVNPKDPKNWVENGRFITADKPSFTGDCGSVPLKV
jgi:hypothetical protein